MPRGRKSFHFISPEKYRSHGFYYLLLYWCAKRFMLSLWYNLYLLNLVLILRFIYVQPKINPCIMFAKVSPSKETWWWWYNISESSWSSHPFLSDEILFLFIIVYLFRENVHRRKQLSKQEFHDPKFSSSVICLLLVRWLCLTFTPFKQSLWLRKHNVIDGECVVRGSGDAKCLFNYLDGDALIVPKTMRFLFKGGCLSTSS